MASDAELIARSLGGDENAFIEMICRHKAAVWAYLARRAGRQQAEDLLGQVWVAAFGSREAYDRSYDDARPWLFGVALNMLHRHWRSRPAEVSVPDVAVLEQGWDPWPAVDERMDAETILRTALAGLRPQEREVLTLMAWEDLTITDAARALGIPPGTARRYLHQARQALRDAPGMTALLALNTAKERR
jgi:RNA polymerase sigma factor (sigma-70 family)